MKLSTHNLVLGVGWRNTKTLPNTAESGCRTHELHERVLLGETVQAHDLGDEVVRIRDVVVLACCVASGTPVRCDDDE